MKNIICFFLFFILHFLILRLEGETVRLQFIKVEKGYIEEFESYMIEILLDLHQSSCFRMEKWKIGF